MDKNARNMRVTSVSRIGHVEYGDLRNGMGRGGIGVATCWTERRENERAGEGGGWPEAEYAGGFEPPLWDAESGGRRAVISLGSESASDDVSAIVREVKE